MQKKMPNNWWRVGLGIWLLLIITSTLFVFQHHFIDLPTGLIVGFLAVYLFNDRRKHSFFTYFMTPRHLKMALYYLLASIILILLSFSVSAFFTYPFICTLAVSLLYAFGLGHLLSTNNGKLKPIQWLLFLPYFLGCKISWGLYKLSLPLLGKVDEKIYIGRFPSYQEYQVINDLKLSHIINLAPELALNKTQFIQHKLPFLDQTMQDPSQLHQVVLLIEKYKSEGVFIHCALGLSRSILVIWAWMIFSGKTNQEIKEHLEFIRPNYVQSKYMQLNINLYEAYLRSL
jgi:protein-tyrosine phosphatase